MKRYLLFAYDEFSSMHPEDGGPRGGMEDFHGDFDEIADARRHLDTLERFDHAEVLDTTDGRRISFDESPPCSVHTPAPATRIAWSEGQSMPFRPLQPGEIAGAMGFPKTLVFAGRRDWTPPGTVAVTPAAAKVITEQLDKILTDELGDFERLLAGLGDGPLDAVRRTSALELHARLVDYGADLLRSTQPGDPRRARLATLARRLLDLLPR